VRDILFDDPLLLLLLLTEPLALTTIVQGNLCDLRTSCDGAAVGGSVAGWARV
jgi:hypothetical protein